MCVGVHTPTHTHTYARSAREMMKDGFYAYGQGFHTISLNCVLFFGYVPTRSASSSQDSVMTTKKQL